ncbi:MAG: two-component sensor histidine kinase [Gammaproteobacteria bacterium HGW-Gammaproteobacteria-1]|nr:MAG: two-component sensor histidine kinase [Gammaproteobacteria bacterium HGW-Gammaproteobacteria-1]
MRLSLTARLTLLFAAASSVVLLALGWLIGVAIERHFEELDRDVLVGKMMLARQVIGGIATTGDYAQLPAQIDAVFAGHHEIVVQVLDGTGKTLYVTPGVAFPDNWATRTGNTPETRLFAWSAGGRAYRGLAETVATAIVGWPPSRVAIAADVGHHAAFMAAFLRILWLFVAAAALLTGLLGWYAARRGLAPLRGMRDQAAAITAHKLDRRLAAEAVPVELASLAAALNDMLQRLEDAFRRLSDFSSDLAHELRTPINNLMMQTQVALSRARDAAAYREILESNAEEYERLARMISDMLFLAKAEHGLAVVTPERVDLARELRDLFEFYDALAEEKGIRLLLAGAGSVRGDRLMLRRALSNLLSNALRHTSAQGGITVTITTEDAALVVAVENPGETIPAHQLPRLFERFYRGDPARQHADGEGMGLGLAIVRAIVQAHKGTIAVTSSGGRTCFTLRLPSE